MNYHQSFYLLKLTENGITRYPSHAHDIISGVTSPVFELVSDSYLSLSFIPAGHAKEGPTSLFSWQIPIFDKKNILYLI